MDNTVKIEIQLQKFIKAFEDLDNSQLQPLFADETTAFFGKGAGELKIINGKENILKVFEKYFEKKKAEFKKRKADGETVEEKIIIAPLDKQIKSLGEIAIVTFELNDNDDFWRRRTFIFKKYNEEYLIIHFHASAENQYKFPLTEIYDKLVNEGGYFNYPLIVETLSTILKGKKEVLELCIGTGNVAIPLSKNGFSVWGIDATQEMIDLLIAKDVSFKDKVEKSPAENFTFDKKFDAIYIHSGHIIFNKHENELRLNILSQESMMNTFTNISQYLNPSGLFIINIEEWNDCKIKLTDGSIYQRTIFEETEKSGRRLHTFFDSKSRKMIFEEADLIEKVSYEFAKSKLAELGFTNFTNHLDTFFYCTFNKSTN